MNLKNILITLSITAALLGIIAFYIVFYGTSGTYVVTSTSGTANESSVPSLVLPSTTASSSISSTLSLASSTADADASSTTSSTLNGASSTGGSPAAGTPFSAAPVSWQEGDDTLTITSAMLSGSQLTLRVQVAMGQSSECVPINLRLVLDEKGNLESPITSQFAFPETGTCEGAPGATYANQEVLFSVDPNAFPVLMTTGGNTNITFIVGKNQDGSLTVGVPSDNG